MDQRRITSKINGKKGGRKKGFAALEAEKARELIAQQLIPHLTIIIEGLIQKAVKGDIQAIKELFDRAWGKPQSGDRDSTKILTISQVLDSIDLENNQSY